MVSAVIRLCLWGVDMEFKNRYRIVKDNFSGYEAQVRYWFIPFIWLQIGWTNTSLSIERAEIIIENHKLNINEKVVKYID